jgi:hypothetical protein
VPGLPGLHGAKPGQGRQEVPAKVGHGRGLGVQGTPIPLQGFGCGFGGLQGTAIPLHTPDPGGCLATLAFAMLPLSPVRTTANDNPTVQFDFIVQPNATTS